MAADDSGGMSPYFMPMTLLGSLAQELFLGDSEAILTIPMVEGVERFRFLNVTPRRLSRKLITNRQRLYPIHLIRCR